MKKFAVQILQTALNKLSRLALWRFKPTIIGITGSAGKTSAKRATESVLSGWKRVRAASGNFNSELGLPLAILGDWSEAELKLVNRDYPAGQSTLEKARFWLKVLGRGIANLLPLGKISFPDTLVLEYGADRPGDLKRLLCVARPQIAVLTAIGETPVHMEYYSCAAEVVREKARLIENLPASGYAILNADDESVMALKFRTRAQVLTLGFSPSANVRISGYEIKMVGGVPYGIAFKLQYGGSTAPVVLPGVFGRVQALACASAAAVGLILGLNLIKISEGLKGYKVAPSRLNIFPGIRGSLVLDDSYNASPLSVSAALDTLKSLPAKRRVAVLGDMLELGAKAMEAHQAIGREAAKIADLLVVAGASAKFIAESALDAGMDKKEVRAFDSAEKAGEFTREEVREGDVVLVKASHSMEFSQIVEALKLVESGKPIAPDAEEVLPVEK